MGLSNKDRDDEYTLSKRRSITHARELEPGTEDGLAPLPTRRERERDEERDGGRKREPGAGLIQQSAKSNPGALITHSIINQSKVGAGL